MSISIKKNMQKEKFQVNYKLKLYKLSSVIVWIEPQYLTTEQASLMLTPGFKQKYLSMSTKEQDGVLKIFSCLEYKVM